MNITEEWLKEIGFKWFDVERSGKHWLLWLGSSIAKKTKYRSQSFDDFGLELSRISEKEDGWMVFFRADYAGRYTRFIYCRDVSEQGELTGLIEALTGFPFSVENSMYGQYYTPERADYFRKMDEERDDRKMALQGSWRTDEKDGSRRVMR